MSFIAGLIGRAAGLPLWIKILPIIAVLGYILFLHYVVSLKERDIANKNTDITKLNSSVQSLLSENTDLRHELTVSIQKAEDTAKSVATLNTELTVLRESTRENEDAIKQYQASVTKRCVISDEWLRLYKQITTIPTVPSGDVTGKPAGTQ